MCCASMLRLFLESKYFSSDESFSLIESVLNMFFWNLRSKFGRNIHGFVPRFAADSRPCVLVETMIAPATCNLPHLKHPGAPEM